MVASPREWICPKCGGVFVESVKLTAVSCNGRRTHVRCEMKLRVKEAS